MINSLSRCAGKQRSTRTAGILPAMGRVGTPALPANPLFVVRCSLLVSRQRRAALLTPNSSSNSSSNSSHRAFSLIELLVVISIIAILMAILLPALSKIIAEAHGTATQEELSSVSAACLSYEATFNAYPGPFSEADISNQDVAIKGGSVITGTQNMLIGLMGTMYNTKPYAFGAGTPSLPADAAYVTITDTNASTGAVTTSYVTNPLGGGPIDYGNGGVQKAAYLNPQAGDLLPEPPSLATSAPITAGGTSTWLPTLYDAFPDGLPVLYYRRNPGMPGATGYPVDLNDNGTGSQYKGVAAYYLGDNLPYTDSGASTTGALTSLDNKNNSAYNQVNGTQVQSCYYSKAAQPLSALNAFANTVDNQSLITTYSPASANAQGNPVQGDFVLISAGADHVYGFNDYSGGVLAAAYAAGTPLPTSDDIVVFGGQ